MPGRKQRQTQYGGVGEGNINANSVSLQEAALTSSGFPQLPLARELYIMDRRRGEPSLYRKSHNRRYMRHGRYRKISRVLPIMKVTQTESEEYDEDEVVAGWRAFISQTSLTIG